MDANNLIPVTGRIQGNSRSAEGCDNRVVSLSTDQGTISFLITAETYVVNQAALNSGMLVTAFYDNTRPVPLIYPPQYQAIVMTQVRNQESVIIRFFDSSLTASDNSLRLNLAPRTDIVTANGQRFTCRPENRTLMVYYTNTTRSIPPQTTPRKIIVF